MFKLKANKSELENRNYEEGKFSENYELQTLNFVKSTIPLYLESISKLKSNKFKSVEPQTINRIKSDIILKQKINDSLSTQIAQNKEIGNITNLKFQGNKAYYEYTSLELDKMRQDEVKKKEKKKFELPPIMKSTYWKNRGEKKDYFKCVMKNKIINFDFSHNRSNSLHH